MEVSMSFTSSIADPETEQYSAVDQPVAFRQTSKRARKHKTITGVWHWLAALVDQGLVSGTRFLTTIIIGRYCGAGELGTYSLAFSVLVLGGCFQEAIVTTPYAVLGQRLRRRSRTTYAGGVARMHFVAAVASALLLLAVALIAHFLQIRTLPAIALVLAVTLPCSLASEFVRRFALAELDVRSATMIDAAVTGIQLSLLSLLAYVKWLNAPIALLAVGAAYLLPAIVWWSLFSKSRMGANSSAARYWNRNWTLGRWLAASQVMAVIHGFMPAWLLAVLVGAQATGEFVAYLNLALMANPLIFAVGNLLTPRAAHTFAHKGQRAAQQLILRVLLYFVTLMAVFALGMSLFGHFVVEFIYGQNFVGSQKITGLLGLTAVSWAISATCGSGLIAFGRPRWAFVASCIGSIVTAVSIVLLAPSLKVYGATLGILFGNATAAAIHASAFIRVSGGLRKERPIPSEPDFEHRFATQDLTNA
jgi:O-antigen/teichoic acid export membrane protein